MPASDIFQVSKDEVKAIFRWIAEREGGGRRTTVLIGGWAVYTYDPYYGSVDIDLVTNSRTRSSLTNHLVGSLGYRMEHCPGGEGKFPIKTFPSVGSVWVDFATRRSPNIYAGNKEGLPYSLLDGNVTQQDLDGTPIPVPTPSLLLLFKMKAAWDRNWRLSNGKGSDPGWERGKMVKDQADILALLNSQSRERFDLDLIGRELERCPFLKEVLNDMRTSVDAAEMYGMELRDAERIVDRFRSLIMV